MDANTLVNILYIALFMIGALAFGIGPIIIVKLLSPTSNTRQTANKSSQLIECGMEPIGDAWIRFGIVYYLYALIFLAFDVSVHCFLVLLLQSFGKFMQITIDRCYKFPA